MAIVFHTIWHDARLHLWGHRFAFDREGSDAGCFEHGARHDATFVPNAQFALTPDESRQAAGDLWSSLLISGAKASSLALRLPCRAGKPCLANESLRGEDGGGALALLPHAVPTLAFSPSDGMDLLTTIPAYEREDVSCGATLRYWARVADLVLELLAQQRFVPDLHKGEGGRYRAYWRVVVADRSTTERLNALIASMPPVCRSALSGGGSPQAALLVEGFLFQTVDALVRRCLQGDELVHAVHAAPNNDALPPQLRWLRALVDVEGVLTGSPDECQAVYDRVAQWLARIETITSGQAHRTCFRLQAPLPDEHHEDEPVLGNWRLTLHLQGIEDPSVIVEAAELGDAGCAAPAILGRPSIDTVQRLRDDVARAARLFPALQACSDLGGPLECALTTEEAYVFLREAAPLLKAEGYGVSLPSWWSENSAQLRLRLEVRPPESPPPGDSAGLGLHALVDYEWRLALGDDDVSLEEARALVARDVPLVRVKGCWTEVRPADIRAAMRLLERDRGGRTTVFDALRLAYAADGLEMGLPVAGIRATGWVERLLNATLGDVAIDHVLQPEPFKGVLRPYQRRGLDWLSFLSGYGLGACLADDMGLGKTIQMIALWLHERGSGRSPGPTLLVVPMSLVGNWQREISRFAPSLKVLIHHGTERLAGDAFVKEVCENDVVISTYGLAHRDHDQLSAVKWHRLALDEAQNIKNSLSKQSVAVRSLSAVHRLALTGTPVENRLSELWSIVDFLNPGYLGSAAEFRRRFAIPIERHHDEERSRQLRELIRPFVLRRLKDDPTIIDDLPEKLEMTVYCNLTREQAALYEAVVEQMMSQIGSTDGIRRKGLILAAIVRLKQICNHPVQFRSAGAPRPAAGPLAHRSGKCDRLVEMLEEVIAEGHRALVFTQYRRMGEILQTHLHESLGKEILFLHGGTPRGQRDRLVMQFQSGAEVQRAPQPDAAPPILILTLKAGGFGLNLTAANHVFHYDRWWNPAVENQATDRAHRVGQDKRVQVHRFVCLGTLEERIAELLERKRALAELVVGKGDGWVTELSTEQLRDLFKLSRDAVAEQ